MAQRGNLSAIGLTMRFKNFSQTKVNVPQNLWVTKTLGSGTWLEKNKVSGTWLTKNTVSGTWLTKKGVT